MPSSNTEAGLLATKPAHRTAEDVEQLVSFLAAKPFFSGVSSTSLELLSVCVGIQHAAPGEVVLHAGELTDRMYLLLSGSCTLVWHSRREGFQPQPQQQLAPGQALCAAALVVSGRRSDVAVTVMSVDSDGGTGGADLAVITRAAWSNMCARAPMKAEYGEARLAMLCCCARALAAIDPTSRTLEQSEDLAALLRLLPGLSHTSSPVLRAMSESAYLRQLPAGTIIFEECTRAESEFLVLAGAVETHTRPKRQGAANRAALRSALRSAVAAARGKSAKGGPKAVGAAGEGGAPKTVRQKIEDERRAREEIKQSLVLQREGLRTPKAQQGRVTGAKAVEEEFKKWMLEFLSRKRTGDDPGVGTSPAAVKPAIAAAAAPAKTGNVWRRAAMKALQPEGGEPPHDEEDDGAHGAIMRSDTTLMEYERKKKEEAGGMRDVGNMLGGAAARKAYIQGIAKSGGMYDEDDGDDSGSAAPLEPSDQDRQKGAGGVHWGEGEQDEGGVDDIDEEEADPWVRLTYLDRRYRVVHKAIRYIDAVEKVMGVAKESTDSSKAAPAATAAAGGSLRPAFGGQDGRAQAAADADEVRNADDVHLLLLSGNDGGVEAQDDQAGSDGDEAGIAGGADAMDVSSAAAAAAAAAAKARGGAAAGQTAVAAAAAAAAGPGDDVDDACDEHLEQLYGPRDGRVETGHLAGELPAAILDRATKAAQRPRRAHSAIAGPTGADVLVVVLETLRRGHDAARDDLVSERLAMLTALEPIRGLSDEHQAQLALACAVLTFDANQLVVRQSQPVDALYVVLEGEVRLLDDPDNPPLASPPSQPPQAPSSGAAGAAGGAAAAGGGGAESPYRSSVGGACKMLSIKTRRAAASLAALTLLGPGGSFGESVLGYPEDVAAAGSDQGRGGDGESSFPASQYLATAMTSRPSKVLVLSRSLLSKYGYLRSSLPPFAELRREAVNGRRAQLKASLHSRNAGASISVATQPQQQPQQQPQPGVTGRTVEGSHSALQLPALPSPTASATAATGGSSNYQTPRPPPVRPSEVLEQLGFKPVLRRVYNALSKTGANVSPSGGSLSGGSLSGGHPHIGPTTAAGGGAGGPASASAASGPASHGPTGTCSSGNSFSNGNMPHLQGASGPDRQRRQDLLAASSFAVNAPQSLSNAVLRARRDDSPGSISLPMVVHSAMPPRRVSADGMSMGVGSPSYCSPSVLLPAPFPLSPQRRPRLRVSVSGAGNTGLDSNGSSPVRRASMSGIVVTNGVIAGLSGGGSIGGGSGGGGPAPASSPARGGRLHVGSTSVPTNFASVMLPRLSVPGTSSFGAPAAAHNTRPHPRPSGAGISEPYLTRLDGGEASPRSFSPAGTRNGRSNSGSIVSAGNGALTVVAPLLPQRPVGQSAAKA